LTSSERLRLKVELVAPAGRLDQQHRRGRPDLVLELAHVAVGEREVSPLPGEQLIDGGAARTPRALDAHADDAPLRQPEARHSSALVTLTGRHEQELTRSALEVQEGEHRGQAELLEPAAESRFRRYARR